MRHLCGIVSLIFKVSAAPRDPSFNMPGNIMNRLEELPSIMLASLSPDQSPQLRNPYDALALFAHAGMLSVGFRLVGLGEDHKIGRATAT